MSLKNNLTNLSIFTNVNRHRFVNKLFNQFIIKHSIYSILFFNSMIRNMKVPELVALNAPSPFKRKKAISGIEDFGND